MRTYWKPTNRNGYSDYRSWCHVIARLDNCYFNIVLGNAINTQNTWQKLAALRENDICAPKELAALCHPQDFGNDIKNQMHFLTYVLKKLKSLTILVCQKVFRML